MHIHILGIAGTFMGSLAQLAQALGHRVTGCDTHVYPPMSTQLAQAGIEVIEGFDVAQLEPQPDLVVVGNVISRGNSLLEEVLNRNIPYTSGPQWLGDYLLRDKWVLAVAGTHGKTTTATMLAWILEFAGMAPGYLIGGVPGNFPTSARLGETDFFVVEADEYDSAFFDKRSKFVHYRPRTLIMNNLEYDHADIFPDLAAIQRQFHHLVRTVPGQGLIVYPAKDDALNDVLVQGCWSETSQFGGQEDACEWRYRPRRVDGSLFEVLFQDASAGQVEWPLSGEHNMRNGLAAIAAARHVGVPVEVSCAALSEFAGVKRRMELLGEINGKRVYDDFAHHPTAIATTLAGLRARVGDAPVYAVIEPRSNTMKQGVHQQSLLNASEDADQVLWFEPEGLTWSLRELMADAHGHKVYDTVDEIVEAVAATAPAESHIVIMSNGGFGGIHQKLLQRLREGA
jgi:UDP-N-acetylmuramate: L-alanyl-gamma-D-glutamyl-meso-diaminopimelate ligase